jgi:hypothetical protein
MIKLARHLSKKPGVVHQACIQRVPPTRSHLVVDASGVPDGCDR